MTRSSSAVRGSSIARCPRTWPVARPLPDRDQPAAVRDPRPGEHQRDVRQRSAGRAGAAQASGDQIAAGQSVFRVRVEASATLTATPEPIADRVAGRRRATTNRADPLRRLRHARAAGHRRGRRFQPDARASRSSGSASSAAPRSATLPQPVPHYTTLARARPGGDGGRLPGPAQPDRAAGRAEADRPRDGHHALGRSTGSCARCRSSAS